jgi:hypothetical protein
VRYDTAEAERLVTDLGYAAPCDRCGTALGDHRQISPPLPLACPAPPPAAGSWTDEQFYVHALHADEVPL